MPVTYGLLGQVVKSLQTQGKVLKHALPAVLNLLKPGLTENQTPSVSSIKEQLKRKKPCPP